MKRTLWIDYLRASITVLVVAHHAALAYTTFSHFDPVTYINSTAPVIDKSRWIVLDHLVSYNDIFFMPLMFFISGLFVYQGIIRRGAKFYLIDRFYRLGIPFIIAVTLIIPFAYFPSFYLATHQTDLVEFLKDYLTHQSWPVGPPWFIWILLLFNLVAALLYWIRPGFYSFVARMIMSQEPKYLLLWGLLIFSIAFIPLSLYVGQYTWTGIGPFDFQLNRILLYFSFFFIGVCFGCVSWEDKFFKGDKLLQFHWTTWCMLSGAAYACVVLITTFGPALVKENILMEWFALTAYDLAFIVTSIFSCCFFLGLFREKVDRPSPAMSKLSVNAYGIYMVHYVWITWAQFVLLEVFLPAGIKFILVFSVSILLSNVTVHFLRKISWIRNML